MRLKINYKVEKERVEYIEYLKCDIIEYLARKHLVGLLEVSNPPSHWDERQGTKLITSDLYVVTDKQFNELMESLDYDVAVKVTQFLNLEIPALNIPKQ